MSTRLTRAPFELRRRTAAYYADAGPPRSPIQTLLVAGAVALAEVVIAVAVVRPGAGILLAPLAGIVGLALVFAFPFVSSVVFVGLVGTVLYSTYFSVNVGVNAAAPQLVLAALLVVALVRPRRSTWGGGAGVALGIYLVLILAASLLAVSAGRVDAQTSRDFTLPFAYLLFYYVVVRLFPEPDRVRRLLAVCVAMAAITGAISVLVALSGDVNSPLQDPSFSAVSSDDGVGGLLRVRLPGVALCYGLFWYAAIEVTRDRRHRLRWTLALAGMAVAIVISLNRNMWIGMMFGLALILVVGGARTRRSLLVSLVAVGTAVAVLLLAGPQSVGPSSQLQPLVKRGETLLAPGQELQDQSLRDRGAETSSAWKALQGHLGLGLGAGASFGVTFRDNLGGGRFSIGEQTFLHNQYLYLIVAGGVGALLAWLAFLGFTALTAWRARGRDPTAAGVFVGLAMVLLSAVVMIAFVDESYMVLLTLLAGAAYTLWGGGARSRAAA